MCRCPNCPAALSLGLDFSSNLPYMLPELLDSPAQTCPIQLELDLDGLKPLDWELVPFQWDDVNTLLFNHQE